MIIILFFVALLIIAVILSIIDYVFCIDFIDIIANISGKFGIIGLIACIIILPATRYNNKVECVMLTETYDALTHELDIELKGNEKVSNVMILENIKDYNAQVERFRYVADNKWINLFYATDEIKKLKKIEY